MTVKVFLGNYKGGVAKTTSTFQIAAWLARSGKKVLLVDLDPQGSLSNICAKHVKGRTPLEKYKFDTTLNYAIELYMRYINNGITEFDLLTKNIDNLNRYMGDNIPSVKDYIYNRNLKFIPSSISFRNARLNDLAHRMSTNILNIFILPFIIEHINESENFDYIFFDCPPTSNTITQSIFMYSDYYLIPTIGDEISAQGVPDYIMEIESVYTKYTMHDKIGGILLNAILGDKPQLIGVFETLYKGRRPSADNVRLIEMLDSNISQLKINSLLENRDYKSYRTHKVKGVEFKHIFAERIPHLDGRTGNNPTSMELHTSNGLMHEGYNVLSRQILEMIEDDQKTK